MVIKDIYSVAGSSLSIIIYNGSYSLSIVEEWLKKYFILKDR